VQERRALGAVEALRSMAAPIAARRGGRTAEVPAVDAVPGDVLVLAEGDVVAADERLLTANDLEVDESLLTGESLPSDRAVAAVPDPVAPVGDRRCRCMVHGGTLVLHGSGTTVVVATSEEGAIGGISRLLHSARVPVTPLQRRLTRLGRALSAITITGCALVAVLGLLRGQPGTWCWSPRSASPPPRSPSRFPP
jgi:Ca2+-transporting ATPase